MVISSRLAADVITSHFIEVGELKRLQILAVIFISLA